MQAVPLTIDQFLDGEVSMTDTEKAASKLGIPLWGRVLINWLWRIGSVFFVGLGLMFWQLVSLSRSVGVLEGEVHQIPANIAKQLLGKAKQAADADNLDEAQKSFQIASILLETAREQKILVPDDFFREVAQDLSQIGKAKTLSGDVHKVRVKLADYHSELQPVPKVSGPEENIVNPIKLIDALTKGRLILVKTKPGDFISGPVVQSLANNIVIDGPVLKGGVPGVTQTLDGVHWRNVIFVNVRIRYEGQEVELNNVLFVNCTFEIVDNHRGNQIVNYALLNKPESLVLDSKTSPSL